MNYPHEVDISNPRVYSYWANLARSDPERFEVESRIEIDAYISQAPKEIRETLREIQTCIDVAHHEEIPDPKWVEFDELGSVRFEDERRIVLNAHISEAPESIQEMLCMFQSQIDLARFANVNDPKMLSYWAELEAIDQKRCGDEKKACIEAFLSGASGIQNSRLRELQWKVDSTLSRASNSLSRCVQMSQMLWDSLTSPGGFFKKMEAWSNIEIESDSTPETRPRMPLVIDGTCNRIEQQPSEAPPSPKAIVLQFPDKY